MLPTSPVIFLMGPTASGKTDLAACLVDRFGAELISVDAAQVYRGMDIGTAKPDREFLGKYPHHLIDIRDPDQSYSAAEFRDDAIALVRDIRQRGRPAVLVGGTMFYFSALQHGLSALPSSDPQTRLEIDREIREKGLAALHRELRSVDPELAATIQPADSQRIQRALEIHRLSGERPSQLMRRQRSEPFPWPAIRIGLFTADRALLHQRIAGRFETMLRQGLVAEVRRIAATFPEAKACASMRSVGYRQVLACLQGECDHEEMEQRGIAATRQLAKRQLTWMRQQRGLLWLEASAGKAADTLCTYLDACHH